MRINNKLKLNKFVHVNIPTNKEYFSRVGLSSLGPVSQYSGDDIVPRNTRFVDTLDMLDRYDKYMQNKANESKSE